MEIEARAKIEDIKEFKEKLDKLGAKYIEHYKVTDYIFMPKDKKWDLNVQSMKIRDNPSGEKKGVYLKYHKVEWKNNIKFDIFNFSLKLKSLDEAFKVMDEWNFIKKFNYTKNGETYLLNNTKIYIEQISDLGNLVEIESDNSGIIDNIFNKLNLKKINKSVPKLFQEYDKSNK